MKTLKDIVKEEEPNRISDRFCGGVFQCPNCYEYLHKYLSEGEIKEVCREWSSEDCK